ncbi:MAG: PKD domain-containing protein [Chloroflexi bacterium]|nr:PKD domain-containing protein [Chloroflexota bacterium]
MRHGWGSGVPRYRSTADPTLGSWTAALPAGDASMRPASGNSCGASLAECSRAHNFSFLETATPGTWIYVAKSSAGFGQSGRGTQVGTLGGGWSAQVDHGGSGGLTGCCGHSTATTMLDQGGSVLFLRSTSGGENTYYRRSTDGGLSWGPLINAYAPDLAGLTTSAPVGLFVPAYGRELVWYAGWGGAESAARVLPLWTASHTYADTGTIRLFGSAGGDLPQPNTAPVVDLGPDIQVRAREAFAFTGVFTDPDPGDSWTGTVDFGDGGPAEALAIRDHAFTVTHTYAAAGTYVLTARIMDAAGAVGTDSLTVTVTQTRAPLIFVPGFGGSQLVATATRSRTITTSEGTSKQVSYSAGELIWLNEFRVGQTLIDPEFFDVLRFNDDGTPPAPNDFATNGELNRLGYPDVEATLREAGYVRDQTYFLFTYDFRFGAETWVQQLDDLVIRALVTNPGAPGVDIVAHSMGTLVTRAYLTNGIHAGNVRAAVLMGGPLLGTLQGSKAALAGQCLWKKGPICVLREQTSQYILRTLPGGLELGVSEAWYDLFRGQDREHPVAYVDRTLRSGPASSGNDYAALREAELARAAGAVALFQAEAFHEDDLGSSRDRASAPSPK